MDTKVCNTCGVEKPLSEFHRHLSAKDGHKSDCKSCRNPLEHKVCVVCGNEFSSKILWKKSRDTCSKKCRYELAATKTRNTDIRHCVQCGKEFVTYPKDKKKLCSLVCKFLYMSKLLSGKNNPNWVETKKLRPSNKKSLARHVKQIQKTCAVCGSADNLHVHHRDSNPQNNSDDNLVLLCKVHHAKAHEEKGEYNLINLILANKTYPQIDNRECGVCHQLFRPRKKNQICCSGECAAIKSGITRRKTTRAL